MSECECVSERVVRVSECIVECGCVYACVCVSECTDECVRVYG